MGVLNLFCKLKASNDAAGSAVQPRPSVFDMKLTKALSGETLILNRYSVTVGTTTRPVGCIRVDIEFIKGDDNVLNGVVSDIAQDNLIALPLDSGASTTRGLSLHFNPSNNIVPSRFRVKIFDEFGVPLPIEQLIMIFNHSGHAF